jgi:hypothetical protein
LYSLVLCILASATVWVLAALFPLAPPAAAAASPLRNQLRHPPALRDDVAVSWKRACTCFHRGVCVEETVACRRCHHGPRVERPWRAWLSARREERPLTGLAALSARAVPQAQWLLLWAPSRTMRGAVACSRAVGSQQQSLAATIPICPYRARTCRQL